jgi:hypothetical protein
MSLSQKRRQAMTSTIRQESSIAAGAEAEALHDPAPSADTLGTLIKAGT